MTRRLLLHIGHSKTGSSYLQSSMALSHSALAAAGIAYPFAGNFERAKSGKMTNGNGADVLDAVNDGNPDLVSPPADAQTVLYSAEHLTLALAEPGGTDRLLQLADAHGFDDVRLLLIIRDPIDHLTSEYSQKVKGGRMMTMPRLAKHYDHPGAVHRLINSVRTQPRIHLTIQNYRCIKDDLIGALARWLDVPTDLFDKPPVKVVNRTLTTDELAFQLHLNKRFGRCTNLIATPLMIGLPQQKGRRPTLGPIPARELLSRIRPDIRGVNRTLPRDHRYVVPGLWRFLMQRPFKWVRKNQGIRLSDAQVRTIVNGLADEIEHLRAKVK